MKNNKVTYKTNDGELISIEIILGFKVEETGKNYLAYTINDDGVSESVGVCISEVDYSEETPKIIPIEKEEAEKVLSYYKAISVEVEKM